MAANALVTTRINESVKQEAAEVLASMGLTVSDAVRLLLTKVAKEKALPFEIWQPNAETVVRPQKALMAVSTSTAAVTVLMPPAVEPGDPPMNMSRHDTACANVMFWS